ncbi:MAG TPA: glycosyltransferase [Terriglobia bacterium]|jgi:glycosyltransferase involved in cell wall biosynthesis
MKRTGQQSSVLNVDPRAPESDAYIKISGAPGFCRELFRHVSDDWVLSVHTNGENPKSWLVALACGLAAQAGPGATLTLHSGGVPEYLRLNPGWKRHLARFAALFYDRIVCVSGEMADAVSELGISRDKMQITPAFLPIEAPEVAASGDIESWMKRHSPLLSTAMFFRPEYGFEVLMRAVARLRNRYPDIGCLVMGTGENRSEAEALIAEMRLGGSVILAGDLDHELCLSLMARSSVFVRPTFRDGDSISVREALALGVPVVASSAAARPAGTMVFETGNVNELVQAVTTSLERVAA